MVTLIFVRLNLHAINSTGTPNKYQSVYILMVISKFTYISGASITTNKNLVSETILVLFLLIHMVLKNLVMLQFTQKNMNLDTAGSKKQRV